MPAGAYEARLTVDVSGEGPINLRVAIEATGVPGAAPLAVSESVVPPTGPKTTVTLPWTSDGVQSFMVSVKVGTDTASARVLISAIELVRVCPQSSGTRSVSAAAAQQAAAQQGDSR